MDEEHLKILCKALEKHNPKFVFDGFYDLLKKGKNCISFNRFDETRFNVQGSESETFIPEHLISNSYINNRAFYRQLRQEFHDHNLNFPGTVDDLLNIASNSSLVKFMRNSTGRYSLTGRYSTHECHKPVLVIPGFETEEEIYRWEIENTPYGSWKLLPRARAENWFLFKTPLGKVWSCVADFLD
ncbi:hypothetical protein KY308_03015 [Candidatus Woesearchaeota archaeon]|nr:hypothetical protein [Candidatus Woesearchaeota archaeon]